MLRLLIKGHQQVVTGHLGQFAIDQQIKLQIQRGVRGQFIGM